MLRFVGWMLVKDLSPQHMSPIFEGPAVQFFLGGFTLKDETDRLFRNIGNQQQLTQRNILGKGKIGLSFYEKLSTLWRQKFHLKIKENFLIFLAFFIRIQHTQSYAIS
jgi:hypothetical protein